MAMYTQVKTTAGYVGLNALEYIMQTVSFVFKSLLVDVVYSAVRLSEAFPRMVV